MERLNVPELNGQNYFTWSIKIQAALTLKRLDKVITEVKPADLKDDESTNWDQCNIDAVRGVGLGGIGGVANPPNGSKIYESWEFHRSSWEKTQHINTNSSDKQA